MNPTNQITMNNERELRNLTERLRSRNKDLRVENQRFLTGLLNDRESGLRNLLISLATFIFTFSSSSFFTGERRLGACDIQLLIQGWVFLFTSILLGLAQFTTDIRFFESAIERENKAEEIWSESFPSVEEYQERTGATLAIFKDVPIRTPYFFLSLQALTTLVGFIFLGIVAASSLLRHM